MAACSVLTVALVLSGAGCAQSRDARAEIKMEDACRKWLSTGHMGPFFILGAPSVMRKAAAEANSAAGLDQRWAPLSKAMADLSAYATAYAAGTPLPPINPNAPAGPDIFNECGAVNSR